MNNLYECMRCKYSTPRKINMKKHFDKLIKCHKSDDAIGFTDDQLYELSLTKVDKRNKIEIDEENKDNICKYCNNKYKNKFSLKRHIDIFCKKRKIDDKKNNGNKIIENNIENQNNVNNTNNTNNTNILNQTNNLNHTNNLNINIINLPIGFEKEWNTEHINKYLKELIVVSDNKYTSLLNKLLDNKKNLNVLVDKEMNNGYIFTNDEYKNIEKEKIADRSMEKLNKELNKMLEEVLQSDEIFCEKNIETHKNLINDKYSEYIKNISIQKIVQKYIIDIYDATKNVANEYLIEYRKKNKEGF